jgi:hypothetical protein
MKGKGMKKGVHMMPDGEMMMGTAHKGTKKAVKKGKKPMKKGY